MSRIAVAAIGRSIWGLVLVCVATLAVAQTPAEETPPKRVEKGSRLAIRYSLALADGSVLDSNVATEPLKFEQGSKQVIAGLSEAVLGMQLGEFKQVTIPPEKAYGAIDPKAFRAVPLSALPPGAGVPGAELGSEDADGRPILMRVARIEGDQAILDFNHPLAGQTLVFDLEVVAID